MKKKKKRNTHKKSLYIYYTFSMFTKTLFFHILVVVAIFLYINSYKICTDTLNLLEMLLYKYIYVYLRYMSVYIILSIQIGFFTFSNA